MSRSFTIEHIYHVNKRVNFDGGRYMSATPSGAARKAFSQAFRNMKKQKSARISLEVHVRETTQGSKHKTYKYKVSKVNESSEANINGETLVFKYTTKVKAL